MSKKVLSQRHYDEDHTNDQKHHEHDNGSIERLGE
ncbi:hypothetical protein SAMN06265350_106167 [Solitalea koreensis]|uniref:Uncharacterized protein n=1 Tax=Solitalea koreensis TaxID=543615 RepID=A0A521DB95_9SPHI|nr:hypothetical protein SAMN06265350_106167 [Solitalea koreensis]